MPGLLVVGELRILMDDIESYQVTEQEVTVAQEDYVDVFWGLRVPRGFTESKSKIKVLTIQIRGEEWCFYDCPQFLKSTRIFRRFTGGEVDAARRDIVTAYRDWQSRKHWEYVANLKPVIKDLKKKEGR